MSGKLFTPRLLQTSSRLVAASTSTISPNGVALRRGLASIATSQTAATESKKPRIKRFQIYRWNPDTPEEKPKMVNYDIDLNQTVGVFAFYLIHPVLNGAST